MYLYCLPFLNTRCYMKLKSFFMEKRTPCLPMTWLCKEPGHQQSSHLPIFPKYSSFSIIRVNLLIPRRHDCNFKYVFFITVVVHENCVNIVHVVSNQFLINELHTICWVVMSVHWNSAIDHPPFIWAASNKLFKNIHSCTFFWRTECTCFVTLMDQLCRKCPHVLMSSWRPKEMMAIFLASFWNKFWTYFPDKIIKNSFR